MQVHAYVSRYSSRVNIYIRVYMTFPNALWRHDILETISELLAFAMESTGHQE